MFEYNWDPNPNWGKINEENMQKYGTADLEEIERMKQYADKCVKAEVDARTKQELQNILPEVQKQARDTAVVQVREEELVDKGIAISKLSPFITDRVIINGEELDRTMFIPCTPVIDRSDEEIRLYFDDLHENWLLKRRNVPDKLVSRFVVVACLIVNASGPGSCRAFVVFLKGGGKPLVFWDGIITSTTLRNLTQFHQRGLNIRNKDSYYESFIRALCMCKNVFFLSLPMHAGWNITPEGRRVFVSSENMIPILSDLFFD
ncbi:hypothetical protein [Ruminococcus flavefaciens]|uniref:hypothetical protein n=1 Tax=Ruminococcus flavefaciens TaxID=1265 RepID=UPI0026EA069A|nr:hypothetical protein [Ruminococcus flavefaciens]